MIELNLTIDEVNIIINALAQRPYIEVAVLFEKVRETAQKSLQEKASSV